MPSSMSASIQVGEPTYIGPCPRCRQCSLFQAPVVAILPTGVQQLGPLTACADCDTAARVVREYVLPHGCTR